MYMFAFVCVCTSMCLYTFDYVCVSVCMYACVCDCRKNLNFDVIYFIVHVSMRIELS